MSWIGLAMTGFANNNAHLLIEILGHDRQTQCKHDEAVQAMQNLYTPNLQATGS
jgi:hypothetical protein